MNQGLFLCYKVYFLFLSTLLKHKAVTTQWYIMDATAHAAYNTLLLTAMYMNANENCKLSYQL